MAMFIKKSDFQSHQEDSWVSNPPGGHAYPDDQNGLRQPRAGVLDVSGKGGAAINLTGTGHQSAMDCVPGVPDNQGGLRTCTRFAIGKGIADGFMDGRFVSLFLLEPPKFISCYLGLSAGNALT